MQTTETEKEKVTRNPKDIEDISSVIQAYIDGGRKGDASIMKPSFRKNAIIHGHTDGGLLAGPIKMLYDWVESNPSSPNLHANILNIDLVNTIATARVDITDWLGTHYTDQFTLLKENDSWVITSKVFHTHQH